MSEIEISFVDGETLKVPSGKTVEEILSQNKSPLRKNAVACKLDGNLYDLSCVPGNGSVIDVIVSESEEGTEILRHSTSHIMAQAVTELFPGTKVAIGPAIDKGFYYDFEREGSFTPEDLKKIEKRMKKIVSSNSSFSRKVISREDAIRLFSDKGEKY